MRNGKNKSGTVSSVGEFGLINSLQKEFVKSKGVIKGIGDDTAVLSSSKTEYKLFTTDMLVEGVHFTSRTSPRAVGHKVLACNISDIAAMGGLPLWAVVSIGIKPNKGIQYINDIYAGIRSLADKYKIGIVGGDTVRSDKTIINLSLLGEVKKNCLVTRNNAKKGDQIFITGPLGRSLKSGKHLLFVPRVKESQYLVGKFKPSAMIDVSDGLVADLSHILEQSRAGAVIYEDQIPKTPGSKLNDALYDGEDFELLFTLDRKQSRKLKQNKKLKIPFYHIGEITSKRSGLTLTGKNGKVVKLKIKGYTHF